jgi:hypothetical protein
MSLIDSIDRKQHSRRSGLLAVWGGLLVSLPVVPLAAAAAPSPLNPCPGIYYQEPFNSTRLVPQGCPPNAATKKQQETQSTSLQQSTTGQPAVAPTQSAMPDRTAPLQPPLPETQQDVVARVTPNTGGTVSVKLVNETNTQVDYQVIGDTNQRSLGAGSQVTLQNLKVPVNVTFVRPDGGFVLLNPQSTSSGELDVRLRAASNADTGRGVLNIQEDGSVLLN